MSAPGTGPDPRERAQERIFALTLAADVALALLFVAVAAGGGSLTAFGEAVRAGVLLLGHAYALVVLRLVHRRRLGRYDYGPGKIESLVWTVLGLAALIGAAWVAVRMTAVLSGAETAASPRGVAAAAIVNALALLVNVLGVRAMREAADGAPVGAMAAQISARIGLIGAHLVLAVPLTAAALARDAAVAQMLDVAGAALLIWLKLLRAVIMLREGVPGLLDAPGAEAVRVGLRAALEQALPDGALRTLRTRRSGLGTEAVVTLAAPSRRALEALPAAREAVLARLAAEGHSVHLAFRIERAAAATPGAPDRPGPPGDCRRAGGGA